MNRVQAQLPARPYLFALSLAVLLLAANVVAQPSFSATGNWPSELAALAPFALVAMASAPSIVSGGGGLDISLGPLMVGVNVVRVVWLLPHTGLDSVWIDVPILIGIGTGVGVINGLLVSVLRYKPMIATLCSFFVLSGLALKISANPIAARSNWTTDLAVKLGPIPGALVLILIPLLIWECLSRTSYLRTLYAVGGNDATAFSAGVDVVRTRLVAYGLGGLFAAIAGIALTALVQSSEASSVTTYTLVALAAVTLGGTPIGGGRGGLVGPLFGALSIYLLQTLLTALNVSSTWLQLVYGILLVFGILVGARAINRRPRVVRA
jgi:ribose transport system permease protein